MKTKLNKNGTYTINSISKEQFNVFYLVMNTVNERCFEEQEDDGDWYSNDDFVCSLSNEEREALRKIANEL